MLKQYKIRHYDFKLVLMVVSLAVIGIFAVGSVDAALQSKQIAGLAFGIFLMLVISLFDYSVLLNLYWLMYVFNLALLALVILMGYSANNAQRWLVLAGIRFQPSELAKILLILFFAQFINKHKENLNTFKYITLCVILFALPAGLIFCTAGFVHYNDCLSDFLHNHVHGRIALAGNYRGSGGCRPGLSDIYVSGFTAGPENYQRKTPVSVKQGYFFFKQGRNVQFHRIPAGIFRYGNRFRPAYGKGLQKQSNQFR